MRLEEQTDNCIRSPREDFCVARVEHGGVGVGAVRRCAVCVSYLYNAVNNAVDAPDQLFCSFSEVVIRLPVIMNAEMQKLCCRMALHRTRQADAERLHRILQRPHARRASQREPIPRSRSGSANHHCLGCRLQHGEAAFFARLQDPSGLCRSSHRNRPSRCAT